MDGPIAHALRPFAGGREQAPIAFLDRDGVLNMSLDGYVNHPHELELLQGTERAMRMLRDEGFLLCVVTNQSAVGRGVWDDERLHQIDPFGWGIPQRAGSRTTRCPPTLARAPDPRVC